MRRTARALRVLGGGLLAAVLLLAVTPAGTWLVAWAATTLAAGQGWLLTMPGREGALATGFAFTDITATNQRAGVHLAIGRVEVSPWSYAVAIRQPLLTIQLQSSAAEPSQPPAPPPGAA